MSNLYNKLKSVSDGRTPGSAIEHARQLILEGQDWATGLAILKRTWECNHPDAEDAWDRAMLDIYSGGNR